MEVELMDRSSSTTSQSVSVRRVYIYRRGEDEEDDVERKADDEVAIWSCWVVAVLVTV